MEQEKYLHTDRGVQNRRQGHHNIMKQKIICPRLLEKQT